MLRQNAPAIAVTTVRLNATAATHCARTRALRCSEPASSSAVVRARTLRTRSGGALLLCKPAGLSPGDSVAPASGNNANSGDSHSRRANVRRANPVGGVACSHDSENARRMRSASNSARASSTEHERQSCACISTSFRSSWLRSASAKSRSRSRVRRHKNGNNAKACWSAPFGGWCKTPSSSSGCVMLRAPSPNGSPGCPWRARVGS